MSISKKLVLTAIAKGGKLRRVHRQLACVGLGVALAACTPNDVELGTEGYVKGFFGGVAGDEPRAVLRRGKSSPLGAMPSMPQRRCISPWR